MSKSMSAEEALTLAASGKANVIHQLGTSVEFAVSGKGADVKLKPNWPESAMPMDAAAFRVHYHNHQFEAGRVPSKTED